MRWIKDDRLKYENSEVEFKIRLKQLFLDLGPSVLQLTRHICSYSDAVCMGVPG